MKKGLLLYNPKSGDQTMKNKLDYILERFQSHDILLIPYRMFQKDDFTESLLQVLNEQDFSFLILSGGDGSLNYTVNFMIRNGINLPLGIFPCGTCNDFARGMGISNDPEEWIDTILSGHTKVIDAGCINDNRYFIGNIGGGLFANVSYNTPGEIKRKLGPAAYYLNALNEIPQFESFTVQLSTEEGTYEEEIILFLISNGKNIAGFFNFLNDADIADGLMDILLFKKARPIELANVLLKVLSGNIYEDPNIIHIKARECAIQADKPVQTSVDGEKGPVLPIKVTCFHQGLRLFCML